MVNIEKTLNLQRNFYFTGTTKDIKWRLFQLKILKNTIKKYEKEVLEALKKDLNKSEFEGYATEVGIVYEEINYMLKNLKKLSKKEKRKTPISQFPAKSEIIKEPYGIVLIIGPFNYPFQLCIAPLIGAIASGNCVILKPSEYTSHTGCIISKIINEAFDKNFVQVVDFTKGREVVEVLINQPFDYIFFTGSVGVGKIIMKAASENLVPVTLELGGKSPCIVDKDAKLELSAKRIIWGKLLNAGQTCVAPDYIYVHKSIKEKFLGFLKSEIINQFGQNIKSSKDYPRIVNKKAFDRLIRLINKNNIYFGGHSDKEILYVEPTILNDISWDDEVMQEEIFGPILPVLEFKDVDDVIKIINSKPKPLALYYFSEDNSKIKKILYSTSSGGVTINDTVIHVASNSIPFGGVGESGIGSYHGKESFETFTHRKSVIKRGTWMDVSIRYAPFKEKLSLIKKIMK